MHCSFIFMAVTDTDGIFFFSLNFPTTTKLDPYIKFHPEGLMGTGETRFAAKWKMKTFHQILQDNHHENVFPFFIIHISMYI